MQRDAACIPPQSLLGQAITAMEQCALRALPVVDHGGRLCGMLGDRDIWWRICQDGEAALIKSVEEVMDSDPPTIGLHAHFDEALRLFCDDRDPDALAVVSGGLFVGLLTRPSFMGMISRLLGGAHTGQRVEVALGNGKEDLAIAFEVLRRSPAELLCASVACSRDDGDEPVLALRLSDGGAKLLERDLARAGLVLLVPEDELNCPVPGSVAHNGNGHSHRFQIPWQ